jgi:branched-chain amino acid transport system substrate-binding protein
MQARKIFFTLAIVSLMSIAGGANSAIKIGFTGVMSGGQALLGQDQYDGFMLAVEQQGGKLGGQPITVFKEDDQLKPEIGSQAIKKLIDKERVDALVGLGFSNVLMASLRPIVDSGTVAIATNAGPSPIAGASCAANLFFAAWSNDGAPEAAGKLAQDKGLKKVYLMAPNYQAGKDQLAAFKRFFKGEIIDEVFTQVGQTDYAAEIAQLQASKPDGVFVFYPGGMGINFIKQMSQAGLMSKLSVYSAFTVDGTTLPTLKEAATGTIATAMWDAVLDNPENKKFVAAFEAKYKRTPSMYAAAGFDAAQLLDVAIGKVNGVTTDKKSFAAAVKAAGKEFKSVRGPFAFNNNNMPIQNYYAFQIVKDGSKTLAKQIATPLALHPDAFHDKCALK